MGYVTRAATLAFAGVAALLVPAAPAWADETATVEQEANLRSAPSTDSVVFDELAVGDTVEVVCWVTGEAAFGDDEYGAMWLLTAEPGYVHSYLVTPVDVPECAGAGAEPYAQPPTEPDAEGPDLEAPDLEVPNIEGPDGVFYDDCHDAVAQGTAPVLRHENGYREDLDADGDGVGCEWVPEDS